MLSPNVRLHSMAGVVILGKLRLTEEVRQIPILFSYNRTFGSAPSPTTDTAWDELFPPQGGFFRHPELAPWRSAFSAFHLLHCLNGIRQGYWALHAAATQPNPNVSPEQLDTPALDSRTLPMITSPSHIKHCIDLLRQNLMCRPDLTLEVRDDRVGGVRGFGTIHQCHSWEELVAWTRQWEGWNQH